MIKCRCCGQILPKTDLITYSNMPKSAQFFPEEVELDAECGVDIQLKQCAYCGLVQAAGQPVSYYRDVIRATGVSCEMRKFREKQYQSWVEEFALQEKKIIEIGCGCGEYMAFMEQTKADVYGLEHLTASVRTGKKAGHRIYEGFVETEEYLIPEGPYDGFYMMNFLEHIPEPGVFLRGIANNLNDGAAGLVEVPNFDMMLQKSLYSEFIQDHLSYFTEDTLRNVLEMNGFEVLQCGSIWYDYILSARVRKRVPVNVDGFLKKQEQIKKQLRQFLEEQKCMGRRVAAWGAGHQALANLSLLEMADDIVYVIDSAAFKQDKYTPATHIPIVAPQRLEKGEVQTVIIMAAGYSAEVWGIMDKEHPGIEKVILTEDGLQTIN